MYIVHTEYEEMHKCPRCGVSRYKVKDNNECSNDESKTKGPPTKVLWYIMIIARFKHLFANTNGTKDLNGMHVGEIVMEWFAIQLIPPNGRRLIVYIQILGKRQEILGLDLPLME